MSQHKVANAGISRKKGTGRVACRLPFIVPMMAYTVRKEGGELRMNPATSHFSATRADFTKKETPAESRNPF